MKQFKLLLCMLAVFCIFTFPAWVYAQHPSLMKEVEPKSYVIPYAMVIILTALSIASMLRPSRRQISLKGNEDVVDDEG